jgi:hypothetical protein
LMSRALSYLVLITTSAIIFSESALKFSDNILVFADPLTFSLPKK